MSTTQERLESIFTVHPLPWRVDARAAYNNSILNANGRLVIDVESQRISTEDEAVLAKHIAECVSACENMLKPGVEVYALRTTLENFRAEKEALKQALSALVRAVKIKTIIGSDIIHELVEAEKLLQPSTTLSNEQ